MSGTSDGNVPAPAHVDPSSDPAAQVICRPRSASPGPQHPPLGAPSSSLSPPGPDVLWSRFFATRSSPDQNALVLHYAPLVKYVTARMAAAYPSHVSREDLVSAGVVGLLSAIERADPDRVKTFESYACSLIRYAVLDELRSTDHLSRTERQKIKRLEEESDLLAARLGRLPTPAELAGEIGWSRDKTEDVAGHVLVGHFVPLDEDDTAPRWISDQGPTPEEAQVASVESASLWSAVAHLPARQKEVIEMFYRDRLHQNEIAPRLGLSPGRVSQIHAQAIAGLRNVLTSLDGGEVPSFPSSEDVPQ